jgi:hypothetical protein
VLALKPGHLPHQELESTLPRLCAGAWRRYITSMEGGEPRPKRLYILQNIIRLLQEMLTLQLQQSNIVATDVKSLSLHFKRKYTEDTAAPARQCIRLRGYILPLIDDVACFPTSWLWLAVLLLPRFAMCAWAEYALLLLASPHVSNAAHASVREWLDRCLHTPASFPWRVDLPAALRAEVVAAAVSGPKRTGPHECPVCGAATAVGVPTYPDTLNRHTNTFLEPLYWATENIHCHLPSVSLMQAAATFASYPFLTPNPTCIKGHVLALDGVTLQLVGSTIAHVCPGPTGGVVWTESTK